MGRRRGDVEQSGNGKCGVIAPVRTLERGTDHCGRCKSSQLSGISPRHDRHDFLTESGLPRFGQWQRGQVVCSNFRPAKRGISQDWNQEIDSVAKACSHDHGSSFASRLTQGLTSRSTNDRKNPRDLGDPAVVLVHLRVNRSHSLAVLAVIASFRLASWDVTSPP